MYRNVVKYGLALIITGLFTSSCCNTKVSKIPEPEKVAQTIVCPETLEDAQKYYRLKEQGLLENTLSCFESQKPEILEEQIHMAISLHYAVSDELEAQALWLHRHLERVLSILEAQNQLEPMLVWTLGINFKSNLRDWYDEPQIPLSLLDDPDCFVKPYQRPPFRQYEDGAFENEKVIQTINKVSKDAMDTVHKLRELEVRIENIHKRLERLEPLVKTP